MYSVIFALYEMRLVTRKTWFCPWRTIKDQISQHIHTVLPASILLMVLIVYSPQVLY